MNLSPSTPIETTSFTKNDVCELPRQYDQSAVIENDWVPAIHLSAMQHAHPIRLAGPLRPMWYVAGAKKLLVKFVRPKRQTV